MNHTSANTISAEECAAIATFFRSFALEKLRAAQVDPNDVRGFKMALVDHFEEIYPRFALTDVFHAHFQKAGHDAMVDEYKRCFNLLLLGQLP